MCFVYLNIFHLFPLKSTKKKTCEKIKSSRTISHFLTTVTSTINREKHLHPPSRMRREFPRGCVYILMERMVGQVLSPYVPCPCSHCPRPKSTPTSSSVIPFRLRHSHSTRTNDTVRARRRAHRESHGAIALVTNTRNALFI